MFQPDVFPFVSLSDITPTRETEYSPEHANQTRSDSKHSHENLIHQLQFKADVLHEQRTND